MWESDSELLIFVVVVDDDDDENSDYNWKLYFLSFIFSMLVITSKCKFVNVLHWLLCIIIPHPSQKSFEGYIVITLSVRLSVSCKCNSSLTDETIYIKRHDVHEGG